MRKMPVALIEHVDPAEAPDGRVDERSRVLAPGDPPGDDLDALARGVELLARRLEQRAPRSAQHHARAAVEEAPRRRPADAPATAGDDDHLAAEVHRVLRSSLVHVHL